MPVRRCDMRDRYAMIQNSNVLGLHAEPQLGWPSSTARRVLASPKSVRDLDPGPDGLQAVRALGAADRWPSPTPSDLDQMFHPVPRTDLSALVFDTTKSWRVVKK